GTGLLAQWTARALERIGFQVVAPNVQTPACVQVGEQRWQVITPHGRTEFASLADLIDFVKQPQRIDNAAATNSFIIDN
ncbi:MAG: hypothetical protein M3Q45_06355, partial [Chloroflexota bacterium]|nr:hypothetical protein [Chloroflexota bacterium]